MPMMAQGQPQMLMQNQMMQYGMHPQMMMQGANGVVFPVMQDQISMYSALSKREQQIEAQSEPLAPVLGGQPPAKRFRTQPRNKAGLPPQTPLLHKKPRGRPPNNRVCRLQKKDELVSQTVKCGFPLTVSAAPPCSPPLISPGASCAASMPI